MARPRSPGAWQAPFLAALATTGNVRLACQAAGVHYTTAYDRRAKCPSFAER